MSSEAETSETPETPEAHETPETSEKPETKSSSLDMYGLSTAFGKGNSILLRKFVLS